MARVTVFHVFVDWLDFEGRDDDRGAFAFSVAFEDNPDGDVGVFTELVGEEIQPPVHFTFASQFNRWTVLPARDPKRKLRSRAAGQGGGRGHIEALP